LSAQCFDILHQIVRKGVVVIDDHDALFHGPKRCIWSVTGQRLLAGRRAQSALRRKSFSESGDLPLNLRFVPDLKLADADAGR
jgi:hypothetical protein